MKNSKMKTCMQVMMVLGLSALYTSEALAVTASTDASIKSIIDFLKDYVIQNMAYVAAFAAFIIAGIAAVGNKIGPVIVDNLGKITFFAFGGGVLTAVLGAAGTVVA